MGKDNGNSLSICRTNAGDSKRDSNDGGQDGCQNIMYETQNVGLISSKRKEFASVEPRA